MTILVQKFGGTSVADTQKILGAARKAIRATQHGHKVVMVVSAMGKTTDHLIALAHELTDRPDSREMDMLMSTGEQVTISLMAIALKTLGHDAISFTGAQMGIKTDSSHMRARIKSISTDRMRAALNSGKIVIAAGFQGTDDDGNITTLGRGGSDTTAVAIAAALGAKECEIYTDVDGVYTTDPRLLPEARKVTRISYDEMLELASLGASVMHSRSIEFAKKFGVAVHVRSSFSDTTGSLIVAEPESVALPVCGVALAKDESQFTVYDVPDRPGSAMQLFAMMAAAKIPTDLIVQNIGADGLADIAFTVPRTDRAAAAEVLQQFAEEIGTESFAVDEEVSKFSVVGLGMTTQTGVAEKVFRAVSDKGINIKTITTSDIKISILVDRAQALDALRAVHAAFELDVPPSETSFAAATNGVARTVRRVKKVETPAEVLARHSSVNKLGMEDILIEEIGLDATQARITLDGVPDTPGLAAKIFELIASRGIVVDLIIQSGGWENRAAITFTVAQSEIDSALRAATEIATQIGCEPPKHQPSVALVSVYGTGLRSHTGLALRIFKTLADAKINVSMIATSEVSITVVIDSADSKRGLTLLQEEFKNEMM
ncbi:MAG: aspartate kinase [Thermoguttaceae bacterium]